MLRKLYAAVTLLLVFAAAAPAFAQDSPAVNPDPLYIGDGYTYLKSDIDRVTLTVCAPNIVPGAEVYAVAYRDEVLSTAGPRFWPYIVYADESLLFSLRAPDGTFYENQCVIFDGYEDASSESGREGMEGAGPTYPETTYYIQVSLVNTLGTEMQMTGELVEFGREGCNAASGGYVLCDQVTSPQFVRPGFNDANI